MINIKLKHILQNLIKNLIIQIFLYQNFFLLERSTKLSERLNTDTDIDLKVIAYPNELENLIKEGYNLEKYFNLSLLKQRLLEKQILFLVFVNKILIHQSLLVLKGSIKIHPPVKIDFANEAYVHFSKTVANYRGRGLFPYVLQEICKYLQKEERIHS